MLTIYKYGISISGHIDGSKKYFQMVVNYMLPLPEGEKERVTRSKTTRLLSKPGNKKQAEAMLVEHVTQYQLPREHLALLNANSGETANMLFADYMEEWFEEKRHAIVPNTRKSYRRNVYKVISPYFREKGILLKDLKAKDINDFYNALRKQGLSGTTIRNYHNNMHTALEHAVKLEIIPNSPMIRIDPPKPEKTTMQTYNEEQVNAYIQEVKNHSLELPVLFAAMYGLRREEACGMRWKSVDFAKNLITVEHVIVLDEDAKPSKWIGVDKTKNDSSYRTLPISEDFKNLLKEHYNKQKENKKLFGNCYDKEWDGYVCVRADGKLITPGYVSSTNAIFLRKHNLEHICFHGLRHTFATLLQKNNVDINLTSKALGHSEIGTTSKFYSHVNTGMLEIPMNVMAGIISL